MEAAEIVDRLRARNPDGLAAAYDAYADRLLSYCTGMLRDRDAAADAVHDTFVIAFERAGQLRDPERLRSWLYAIARNECLRMLRGRQRTTELDEAATVSDETVEIDADLRDDEVRALVWAAADGLNPREREVLDLAVRHDLDMAEVAGALGVPSKHAHALLSKARQQLERAVAVLIVVRTGRRDCPELAGLVGNWDGSLTVLLRKRIARHIDGCGTCAERRRRDVNAEALFAAAPLLVAPLALRDEILATSTSADGVEIADRAGRFDRDGFPVPFDGPRRSFGVRPGPAAAAVLITAAVVGGVLFADHQRADSIEEAPPLVPVESPSPTQVPPPETSPPAEPTAPAEAPPEPETPRPEPPVRTPPPPVDPGDEDGPEEPVRPTTEPPRIRTADPTPDPTSVPTVDPTPPRPRLTLVPQPPIIVPPPDPDDDREPPPVP